MNRRDFLKVGIGGLLLPQTQSIMAFDDYSQKNELDKYRNFTYVPEKLIQEESNYSLDTDFLPTEQRFKNFWDFPRSIYLKRADTGERVNIIYYANNRLIPDGYRAACYIMRDNHVHQMTWMDPKLLDLLCAVQAWLKYYGYHEPLYLNSGYRTPYTNAHLEGAAKNSMHMYGKAADISFKLPSSYLVIIAKKFQAGGIGWYPSQNFTHLDTGKVRYWKK